MGTYNIVMVTMKLKSLRLWADLNPLSSFRFNDEQPYLEIHDDGYPYIGKWKIQTREAHPSLTRQKYSFIARKIFSLGLQFFAQQAL